jgi:hypothetical protein
VSNTTRFQQQRLHFYADGILAGCGGYLLAVPQCGDPLLLGLAIAIGTPLHHVHPIICECGHELFKKAQPKQPRFLLESDNTLYKYHFQRSFAGRDSPNAMQCNAFAPIMIVYRQVNWTALSHVRFPYNGSRSDGTAKHILHISPLKDHPHAQLPEAPAAPAWPFA